MNHFFGNNQNRLRNYNLFKVSSSNVGSIYTFHISLYDTLATEARVTLNAPNGLLLHSYSVQPTTELSREYSVQVPQEDFEIRIYGDYNAPYFYSVSLLPYIYEAEINRSLAASAWAYMLGSYAWVGGLVYETTSAMVADQANQIIGGSTTSKESAIVYTVNAKTGSINDYTASVDLQTKVALKKFTINKVPYYGAADEDLAIMCRGQYLLEEVIGLEKLVSAFADVPNLTLWSMLNSCWSLTTPMPTAWVNNPNLNLDWGVVYEAKNIPNYASCPAQWKNIQS